MPRRLRRHHNRLNRRRLDWDALETRRLCAGDAGAGLPVPAVPLRTPYSPWSFGPQVPVPADYDGDGRIDLAIYETRSWEWSIDRTSTEADEGYRWLPMGDAVPVPADYDGDGRAEPAYYVWDLGLWTIDPLEAGGRSVTLGSPVFDDYPVPADYDGDGRADLAVFRPGEARWLAHLSGGGVLDVTFGLPGGADFPVPADYDGDGRADLAVFRWAEARWLIRLSGGGTLDLGFGAPGQVDWPVPADYDGDGRADPAVYRRPTGQWLIAGTSSGPQSPTFDPAVIPVQRLQADWLAAHDEQVAWALRDRPPVVLLGDSITFSWGDEQRPGTARKVWLQEMAPLKAANFGVPSDSSRTLLWRVRHGALAGKPRVAVLMIGINDLRFQGRTPEEVARSVSAVVQAIRELSPRTRVLLQAVLPSGVQPDTSLRAAIAELNVRLAGLADGPFVQFLDFGDRLLDDDGTLPARVSDDGLHLTEAGYRIWADAVRGPIATLARQWSRDPRLDLDGDGMADLVVFRPGLARWLGRLTGGAFLNVVFGEPGSTTIPVPGDYDGDGRTDLAVFQVEEALWIAVLSGGGVLWRSFGAPGLVDLPVPGDYDGDGRTDLAVFRSGEARWLAHLSGGGVMDRFFGAPGLADLPVPGDYDGDGRTDLAVFRSGEARWLAWLSDGGVMDRFFGAPGLVDLPIAAPIGALLALGRADPRRWT